MEMENNFHLAWTALGWTAQATPMMPSRLWRRFACDECVALEPTSDGYPIAEEHSPEALPLTGTLDVGSIKYPVLLPITLSQGFGAPLHYFTPHTAA